MTQPTPDPLVLTPPPRLDSNTSAEFERRLMGEIGDGRRNLVVDFSDVDYISSAGLRVLLIAAKRLRPDGRVALAGLKDNCLEVFEISGFVSIFPIYPSAEAACADQ